MLRARGLARLRAAPGAGRRGARGWLRPAGHDTGARVHNSRSRRKEPLVVGSADAASWYSCGPTVYDHAHLGHACSYVRFDIIRRILTRVFGCSVVMVMGITDVDDKIIQRAGEMQVSPASLARLYEEEFKQDMAALKVLPPTAYMRVTDNIPQIIAFIEGLVARGHAYPTVRGNVYFDLQSRGDKYGQLGTPGPGPAGEPADSDKRHAGDFALWKAAKPREVWWASPWGPGRPGWHIECSAMCSSVFGSRLDIHSGGVDLAFPHHENEIAQCEAFHQCEQWGNYFLHAGHLHVKGKEKMSKSLKNYVTIKDFLRTSSPDAFRLFCLRSRYRSGIDYSDGSLLDAERLLRALAAFVEDARAYVRGQLACGSISEDVLWERLSHTKGVVRAALADDFDTPRAVDAIMDLVHHGNRQLRAATEEEPGGPRSPIVFGSVISYVEQFFDTVGVSLAGQQSVAGDGSLATLRSVLEELVRFRLRVRQFALAPGEPLGEARQRQLQERRPLLEACDALRQDLAAHGVSIKDRASTSTWELRGPKPEDQTPGH
ncbi:probable cysteine--tRNA ligase, mitochondrial [Talpa occidentalis]|uniref:probable cysteine--tRNA ligase, mitochondrial n=1 Tax=Talpa occidentalis TaxID=50954 RepID=UPI0018906086|nr:probable cysteine--tRNA ligase, mitochondrial [Talpa occidentalis]